MGRLAAQFGAMTLTRALGYAKHPLSVVHTFADARFRRRTLAQTHAFADVRFRRQGTTLLHSYAKSQHLGSLYLGVGYTIRPR